MIYLLIELREIDKQGTTAGDSFYIFYKNKLPDISIFLFSPIFWRLGRKFSRSGKLVWLRRRSFWFFHCALPPRRDPGRQKSFVDLAHSSAWAQ